MFFHVPILNCKNTEDILNNERIYLPSMSFSASV